MSYLTFKNKIFSLCAAEESWPYQSLGEKLLLALSGLRFHLQCSGSDCWCLNYLSTGINNLLGHHTRKLVVCVVTFCIYT